MQLVSLTDLSQDQISSELALEWSLCAEGAPVRSLIISMLYPVDKFL